MKKIYTWPENQATNYFDPDYYGDNTYGMKKRLLDVRGSTYLTPLNPNSSIMGDAEYLETRGVSPLYQSETSETGHISQYDLWLQPLLQVRTGYRSHQGWRWINPWLHNQVDYYAPYDSIRLETASGEAHYFQDGDNMWLGNMEYPLESARWIDFNRATHAIIRVIDSITIELYRNVDYDADGNPDWVNGNPVPFIPWHFVSHQYDTNPNTYDSRPNVTYRNNSNGYNWFGAQDPAKFANFGSGFGADWQTTSNRACAINYTHPLRINKGNGAYWTDWRDYFYGLQMSDQWTQHFSISADYQYKLPYNTDFSGLPAHTLTHDTTIVGYNGGPVLADNVFYKVNHGLVDGDVVNIVSIKGWQAYAGVGDHALKDSGTKNTFWVERLDNDHYVLHITPYEVRDANITDPDNRTMVKFIASGLTYYYTWDQDGNITENVPLPGIYNRVTVRKAQIIHTEGTNYHSWAWEGVYGDFVPVYNENNPGNLQNTYPNGGIVSTGGFIGASSREPLPKRVYDVEWAHMGNIQYGYLDSNGNMIRDDAAVVNTDYGYTPNAVVGLKSVVEPYSGIIARNADVSGTPSRAKRTVKPVIPAFTDSNGYLENTTQWTINADSLPSNCTDIMTFRIQNKPDQYVEPAFTYTEDTWDTADYWTTLEADDDRYWPDHVRPSSAKITVVQPGSVNRSQSGIKYQRTLGVVRYQIELQYPPMTEEQFAPFLGAVQGARGQHRPFYLKLRYKNRKGEEIGLLFQDPANPNDRIETVRIRSLTDNNRVIEVDGLAPSLEKAIKSGQHFGSDSSNRNGQLNTIIQDQRSNVFGESKFRIAYPALGLSVGDRLDLNPDRAVVTLTDDNFEYETDITGFYTMSVIFELDEFK